MLISHKIRLQPNNKQATYFAKAAVRKLYRGY
ncbi:helix-turn-helix domain-containing protein [uncultured Thiothrix sp.]